MAELVERPRSAVLARGGLFEDLGRTSVREARLPAGPVDVAWRECHAGLAVGEEQRAGLAARQQPRQQPGRPGLPDDDVDRAAFADDGRLPVGEVEVLDVQAEDLSGPRGGLV